MSSLNCQLKESSQLIIPFKVSFTKCAQVLIGRACRFVTLEYRFHHLSHNTKSTQSLGAQQCVLYHDTTFFNYVIVDRLPSRGLLMIASRMIARVAQQIHDIDIGFFCEEKSVEAAWKSCAPSRQWCNKL